MKSVAVSALVGVLVCFSAPLSAQTRLSPQGGTLFEAKVPPKRKWTDDDIRKCVDIYAPIISFTRNVKLTPTAFTLGDQVCVDYCCYVNVQKGSSSTDPVTFQYWFYYPKDVRIEEAIDGVLGMTLDAVCKATPETQFVCRMTDLDRLFHEHDWELISVTVKEPYQHPWKITYYAHGGSVSLDQSEAQFVGKRPLARVVTDMHGTYPSGNWQPKSERAKAEWLIGTLLGGMDETRRLDFAGHCRPFTLEMMQIATIPGYKYAPPWKRGFTY